MCLQWKPQRPGQCLKVSAGFNCNKCYFYSATAAAATASISTARATTTTTTFLCFCSLPGHLFPLLLAAYSWHALCNFFAPTGREVARIGFSAQAAVQLASALQRGRLQRLCSSPRSSLNRQSETRRIDLVHPWFCTKMKSKRVSKTIWQESKRN